MSAYLQRLPRRALSVSVAIIALAIMVALAPFIVSATLIADALIDWKRHRFIRGYLMITALLVNEALGLIALVVAWILSGFGLFTHSARSYRLLGAIHGQWTHNITRATEVFFDATIEITGAELVDPAPVIILQRHISLLDAVLPSKLLAYRRSNAPRHVLMRELRTYPCIETVGHRTPNHFVDRSTGGPKELAAIEAVGSTLGPLGSGVIFPEGGFRTEARYERAVASLEKKDARLAERARSYRHVMPPRPGGTRALLQGAPGVDVIVIAHVGYEGFSTVKEIVTNAPISRKILVELRRIPRDEIPLDEPAFSEWLFDQYDWIDGFVDQHLDPLVDLTAAQNAESGRFANETAADSGSEDRGDVDLRDGRESVG